MDFEAFFIRAAKVECLSEEEINHNIL